MGPRPDGRGRGRAGRARPRRRPASMGPRPDGRGRQPMFKLQSDQHARQWGRGRMAAEGCGSAGLSRRAGCVNGAAAGWPRKACRPHVPDAVRDNASMGPRPDGRGRSGYLILMIFSLGRQWGRGRMAAEGALGATRPERPRGRQWGRGRMAAEGYEARRQRRGRAHKASMGPRPDGRGRHGQARRGSGAPGRVNGAAAGWPRKGTHTYGFTRLQRWRQWGRGRMAAEGGRRKKCGSMYGHSVNGAAAGWPRKDVGRTQGWRFPRRQWGRGRMAAEGAGHGERGRPPVRASMGPRPDGRGRHRSAP